MREFEIEYGVLVRYNGSESMAAIPEGVTVIGAAAFEGCRSLEAVFIPDSVTCIEKNAFRDCAALGAVTFGSSRVRIEPNAFAGCRSLTLVNGLDGAFPGELGVEAALSQPMGSLAEALSRWPADSKALAEARLLTVSDSAEAQAFRSMERKELLELLFANPENAALWYAAAFRFRAGELIILIRRSHRSLRRTLEKILMTKPDHAAARYFDRQGRLGTYAACHGTDADGMLDEMTADLRLEEDCSRTWALGNARCSLRLDGELNPQLYGEGGVPLGTLPPCPGRMTLHPLIRQDLDRVQEQMRTYLTRRTGLLYRDFLAAAPRSADSWKRSFLGYPLPRALAGRLVWQQGEALFTLTPAGEAIDAFGNPVTLTDAPIRLAHPMEMDEGIRAAWVDRFWANQQDQPFCQLSEPLTDPASIQPDRYARARISAGMLRDLEPEGINISTGEFRDCSVRFSLEPIDGDPEDTWLRLWEFRFPAYNRQVNHIVGILDRCVQDSRPPEWLDAES